MARLLVGMPDGARSAPRRLLARLRETLAHGVASLEELVSVIAGELTTEACSIYAMRAGEILELVATEGLRLEAVGRTRLRVGEGIVGLSAATGAVMNLPDAQNHPAFAYRGEIGEDRFASLLAIPIRRAGRTLGVLSLQSEAPRTYTPEEVDVLETLAMLLAEVLAESGATAAGGEGLASTLPRAFPARVLSPGIAVGPLVLHGTRFVPHRFLADDPAAELKRLHEAADRMQRGLSELLEASGPLWEGEGEGNPDLSASRDVLQSYQLIASDGGWIRRVAAVIGSGLSAEAAVQRVAAELRDRMRRITDPYLRERLADIEDLAGHLLTALSGDDAPADPDATGAILLARRLGPAELLAWHSRGIAGVVIEEASPSGHAAIVARALAVPAVTVRGVMDAAGAGDQAVLDADEGHLVLRPDAEVREGYLRAMETRSEEKVGWALLRGRPAVTADGARIKLMLNVGLALELDQLDAVGADGIGLFRTEIAMLARGTLTDLGEQAAVYSRVLDAVGDRPVLFRTLDLGGDKVLPGIELDEENPALGWRSIRIGLDRPALLRRQLRALLLAAGGRPLSVMFPMIATIAEFKTARGLLLAEAKRVRPSPRRLSIGTMLEVPALMWQLPALFKLADFISIGSNDLMQFLFAADRTSPSLAGRYELLSAPVFNLLTHLLTQANEAGVPVSFCGEAASRPLDALVLAGLGLRTLSMPSTGILPVKAALAKLDVGAFHAVLEVFRKNGAEEASLREPIEAWAREQGVAV